MTTIHIPKSILDQNHPDELRAWAITCAMQAHAHLVGQATAMHTPGREEAWARKARVCAHKAQALVFAVAKHRRVTKRLKRQMDDYHRAVTNQEMTWNDLSDHLDELLKFADWRPDPVIGPFDLIA